MSKESEAAIEEPTANGHDAIDEAVAKVLAEPKPVTLTEEEAELFAAYAQLDRLIFELHIQPLQRKIERLYKRIEARAGLSDGALGAGYRIDAEARQAVPVKVPQP